MSNQHGKDRHSNNYEKEDHEQVVIGPVSGIDVDRVRFRMFPVEGTSVICLSAIVSPGRREQAARDKRVRHVNGVHGLDPMAWIFECRAR